MVHYWTSIGTTNTADSDEYVPEGRKPVAKLTSNQPMLACRLFYSMCARWYVSDTQSNIRTSTSNHTRFQIQASIVPPADQSQITELRSRPPNDKNNSQHTHTHIPYRHWREVATHTDNCRTSNLL